MLGAIGGSHAAGSSQSHLESAQRFSSHWAWSTNVYNPPFVSQRPSPEAGREPCNLCLLNKLLAFYSIFSTSRTGMLSQERVGSPFSGVQSWGVGVGVSTPEQIGGVRFGRPVGPGPASTGFCLAGTFAWVTMSNLGRYRTRFYTPVDTSLLTSGKCEQCTVSHGAASEKFEGGE